MIIEGGNKESTKAVVNLKGALSTDAVNHTEQQDATANSLSYNINTGEISLTTTANSAVLYFKNNDTAGRVFKIDSIAVGLGSAATLSDLVKITVVRNPTTGTIVDDATAVDMNQNRNFGSSETLTADTYKGADAKTFTNGDDIIIFYQGEGGRLFASIDLDIPKGSSVGVEILPTGISAGTMLAYAALIGHLKEDV